MTGVRVSSASASGNPSSSLPAREENAFDRRVRSRLAEVVERVSCAPEQFARHLVDDLHRSLVLGVVDSSAKSDTALQPFGLRGFDLELRDRAVVRSSPPAGMIRRNWGRRLSR